MLEVDLTIITHVNFKKYRAKQINQKPTKAASKQHSNTQQKTKQDTPTMQPAKLESHIQKRPKQTKPSALSVELESDVQERSMALFSILLLHLLVASTQYLETFLQAQNRSHKNTTNQAFIF